MILAFALLPIFLVFASSDGFYYHFYRFRLHARGASRYEHLLHTLNACLFVPQVYLFFCGRPTGAWLIAAVGTFIATLGVEALDVLCEGDSRAGLGGLPPREYLMHFLMSGLRGGFVAAYVTDGGLAAFTARTAFAPPAIPYCGWFVLVPAVAVAAWHVALWFTGGRRLADGGRASAV